MIDSDLVAKKLALMMSSGQTISGLRLGSGSPA